MNAFTIYLIPMLDEIKHAATGVLFISFIAILVSVTTWLMFTYKANRSWNQSDKAQSRIKSTLALTKKAMRYSTIIALIVFPVHVLLPSTKTAATKYVIPTIVNNETIQTEAGEIYDLAKSVLKNLVEKEK